MFFGRTEDDEILTHIRHPAFYDASIIGQKQLWNADTHRSAAVCATRERERKKGGYMHR